MIFGRIFFKVRSILMSIVHVTYSPMLKRRAVSASDPASVRENLEKILKKHDDPRSVILELMKIYHLDSSSLTQAAAGE